ncbi:MAG: hypothetical protein JSS97_09775 [Actinobacteria bacterium]|nr:hypothetical protein [Actinomycetota bacterium]
MTSSSVGAFVVDTVGDMEWLNRRAGHHFFDGETMRFFGSRVSPRIVAHRFFVTSERTGFEATTRRSTLRMIRDGGPVETVGEFLAFGDNRAAFRSIERARSSLDPRIYGHGTLAAGGVSVRFDPYPACLEPGGWVQKAAGTIGERRLDRAFVWRAYVGELAIGRRTSKADARAIASEAVRPCPCIESRRGERS